MPTTPCPKFICRGILPALGTIVSHVVRPVGRVLPTSTQVALIDGYHSSRVGWNAHTQLRRWSRHWTWPEHVSSFTILMDETDCYGQDSLLGLVFIVFIVFVLNQNSILNHSSGIWQTINWHCSGNISFLWDSTINVDLSFNKIIILEIQLGITRLK